VSVVQSLTVRTNKALHILRVLIESCFGSLFFHFSFWTTGLTVEKEKRSITIGLYVLVLDSSMLSMQNLFTESNQNILFADYIMQNPSLSKSSLCKGTL